MDGGSEVVDDPADGLDVGVLRLPLVMTAVITSLHDVHAAAEVRLFIHHPPEDQTTDIHHMKDEEISYDRTIFGSQGANKSKY